MAIRIANVPKLFSTQSAGDDTSRKSSRGSNGWWAVLAGLLSLTGGVGLLMAFTWNGSREEPVPDLPPLGLDELEHMSARRSFGGTGFPLAATRPAMAGADTRPAVGTVPKKATAPEPAKDLPKPPATAPAQPRRDPSAPAAPAPKTLPTKTDARTANWRAPFVFI